MKFLQNKVFRTFQVKSRDHSISRIFMTLDSSEVSSPVECTTATFEPDVTSPFSLAAAMHSLMTDPEPHLCPITPLMQFIYLITVSSEEQARMLSSGLYLETSLASLPDSVRATISLIWVWSMAAEQTAEATAS